MSEITAFMVRELREKSGAGMMECKKALEATNGDTEAAFDELRKSGLKTAAKKAGRDTSEGRVASCMAEDGKSGSMVAIACETDFVAKTPHFEGFLADLAAHTLEHEPADLEACMTQPWKGDGTVQDALSALVGKLGENIQIVEVQRYENPEGFVGAYVHHDLKKGALVSVCSGGGGAADALKDLCMHIVVFNPAALDRGSISEETVGRERAIIQEGLAGKPEEIQEKIMVGRLEKFFAENTLIDQPWIKDDKQSVSKAIEAAMGEGAAIHAFQRFQVGS